MSAKSYAKVHALYQNAVSERSDFETEWRAIANFLVPGRGNFNRKSKPTKRRLTSPNILNDAGGDALEVLTAGMHSGLTSPSRPWCVLEWADTRLTKEEPLKAWMEKATKDMHKALQQSNFYSIINSFYIEYASFGCASFYVGEDTTEVATQAFRFELLTAGEYAIILDTRGLVYGFFREIFKTPRQLVELFPVTVRPEFKEMVDKNEVGADSISVSVLEYICKEEFQGKAYTRAFYDNGAVGRNATANERPLSVSGFTEMPYMYGRWGTISGDPYGLGPGSKALPDIKRLQELEASLLMGVHKTIDPPVTAPSSMRGKLDTLPGGRNYHNGFGDSQVRELYANKLDLNAIGVTIERVEDRIAKKFYNELFLTAGRDPNASPLRTGQVQVMEQEKMIRLGPTIERLQHEVLLPMLERCFNIMMRKQMFDPIPEEYRDMISDYKITMVSPLATAQRMVAMAGINTFLQAIGNMAQFDETVIDNVDVDLAAREIGDISGVDIGILRPLQEVKQRRDSRAKQQQAALEREQASQDAQVAGATAVQGAEAKLKQAQAGSELVKANQLASEM